MRAPLVCLGLSVTFECFVSIAMSFCNSFEKQKEARNV
jgi:hypothetical protein